MTIRELGAEDYDRVFAVWERSGLESLRPRGRDSRGEFSRQIESGRSLVLGLEVEGELAAVVVATDDGRKGWINRLVVDLPFLRRGYGRRLLRAAQDRLAGRGLRILSALIEEENEASLALFRSEGYDWIPSIRYLARKDDPDV